MFQPRIYIPLHKRFTWRLLLPVLAAASVLVYPVYCVLDAAITHGIHQDGNLLRVDIKALSNFDLDQVSGVTQDIPFQYRNLDGKRVELTGVMWDPYTATESQKKFDLIYSFSCCCSGPPLIQHFVKCTVLPGGNVDYHSGIVRVVGTLHVGVIPGAITIASVYRLDVERVDPVEP
jgi:hypothetical protein